ncbi:DsrE family protein [Iocasia frigidifontis]|uniref:DsrE family protein n=1 Tax=Iocasia fonsfrigidae TaxID=2682810 RepID=A0A8A7KEJ6_9FIRM|nr:MULTISPECIES: DsrE family protein [Halanaerobiaceae]AZO95152.1 DsrE family protein [Halocella sp. SP3-1]QTL98088.1 DsrE family protein [Iocasia fonsfrigidae]
MNNTKKLYILWTNADPITSEKMVMMYAINSKLNNWWQEVSIIVWGATANLIVESDLIQEKIKQAIHVGVNISACKACADQLGVSDTLVELGIELKYWGEDLTEILKANEKLLNI